MNKLTEKAIEQLKQAVANFEEFDDMGEGLYNASVNMVNVSESGTVGLKKLRDAIRAFENMEDDGESMYEAAGDMLAAL